MFGFAIKKIINNKILMLSLFAGILSAVLIACTIPVYSSGISHRMFVTQLETYQNENSQSPGAVIISCSLTAFKQTSDNTAEVEKNDSSANLSNFEFCTNYLNNDLYKKMNMPALVKGITLSSYEMAFCDVRDKKKNTVSNAVIRAVDDYENAVEIISGREPSETFDEDGYAEVIISRAAQATMHYSLDTVLEAASTTAGISGSDDALKIKIVGVFDYKEDPENPIVDSDTGCEFYCNYDFFFNELFKEKNLISKVTWYFAGDYTKFDLNKTDQTIEAIDELTKNLSLWGLNGNVSTVTPPLDQYVAYRDNVNSVNILLVLFYAPIMILIVFFIFMISKFVVENDKNEIAMLNSRGASRKQILLLYLCQGGLLAIVSVIVAPLLSLLLCSLLGSTSGFLEFAQRAPMKLSLSFSAVFCSIVSGILAIVTMLVPVYKASKTEIVEHKRRAKSPIISKIVMLVTAIATGLIAFYAYYVLVIQKEGLITETGGIQPLAYLFLICFFVSFALLFVLGYPLILKLLLKMGATKWKPDKFSAFSRISRMEIREKFIVIFLTLTIAIGMFSSISARTLNKNLDNSTRYKNPCDIMTDVTFYATDSNSWVSRDYFFGELEDTDATKIILGNEPRITTTFNTSIKENISFMGIEPSEFGKIITWNDSILPKPMKYYLNLLKENPTGCIISKNTAAALGNIKVGANVNIRPDSTLWGNAVIPSTVLAIVDAWPTYYPTVTNASGVKTNNYLIVTNSSEVERVAFNQPYSVWMNTDKSVDELKMFAIHHFARLTNITNGAREIYLSEINSVRQATNGSLTLGFIAAILACAIGFAIYWVLSIKSRTLHIGTMRALGMSLKEIYSMIVWEQILLCAASVVLGIAAGILSGIMFAPLLQSAFETMGNMPPYTVAINVIDVIKLIILTALLIGAGIVAAFTMLKRIKASSAIKLGEE